MGYGAELMSRKAKLLKDYLTETEGIGKLIEAVTPQSFEFDDLREGIDKREIVISKIKEIDGILNREQFEHDKGIEKHRWLCNKLIKQIAEAEEKNQKMFQEMIDRFESVMKQNSDAIRGINAYFSLDMQNVSRQEWKK